MIKITILENLIVLNVLRLCMQYSDDRLNQIYDKTNGICRHCGKQLAFKNFGNRRARGGWEVDHSVPRSRGGSDNLRNLWPTCRQCNLSKSSLHGT